MYHCSSEITEGQGPFGVSISLKGPRGCIRAVFHDERLPKTFARSWARQNDPKSFTVFMFSFILAVQGTTGIVQHEEILQQLQTLANLTLEPGMWTCNSVDCDDPKEVYEQYSFAYDEVHLVDKPNVRFRNQLQWSSSLV